MHQTFLPLIPEGASHLTGRITVHNRDGQWYYFYGAAPVFTHMEDDLATFRMYTSQLYCDGHCKQSDIIRVFGVSESSVKRAAKKYREEGPAGFYKPRKGRGPSVISEQVKKKAEALMQAGWSKKDTSEHLGIKYDTLFKAIKQGRVYDPSAIESPNLVVTDRSRRSAEDADPARGMACTRTVERTLAATGAGGPAQTRFDMSRDVSFGGVLCALPALLSSGLLRHLGICFEELKGYYTTVHIILLLAYMALCRIKSVEQLRHNSPGEMGRLMGLDRIPEVRCLREKIKVLSDEGMVETWHSILSKDFMLAEPTLTGVLYVDGHVRVYHGSQTKLPKRYVARDRLCMRGTTDYWVNDAYGQPFFVVTKPVDGGLLRTLREDIVPRLLKDIPGQPSEKELARDSGFYRFILVFDREGYSPGFFKEMWDKHRICCLTYHKHPGGAWPEGEFKDTEIEMPGGERIENKLAGRGVLIGSGKNKLWVNEVRKLTGSGHQTSIISPGKAALGLESCGLLFNRWCQENFFRYMMQEFALDALSGYETEEMPETQPVVNPRWRELDSACRSVKSKLGRKIHQFGQLELDAELTAQNYEAWKRRKSELREEIEHLEKQHSDLKQERKGQPKHIKMGDLPEEEKFKQFTSSRKLLRDTIKMIAYRAETSMANKLRKDLGKPEEARSFLRGLYSSPADLIPDPENNTLHVRIHHLANPQANRAVAALTEDLNETECVYPGTEMKLRYSLVKHKKKQKQVPLQFP